MEDEIDDEYAPLLRDKNERYTDKNAGDSEEDGEKRYKINNQGLSLLFATLCIIDLFGVFPIVTMPRPIIECGWVGIPLVFGVFILQVYTAMLLGRCWIMAERIDPTIKKKSRRPYAALAEMTYGPIPGRLVTLLLDLTVFAGGVPNLLVASQNMQLLGENATMMKWDISYCYWMPFIGLALCPFMWLGSPKDMKWLVVSSSCVVMLVSLLSWSSIAIDNVPSPPTVPLPSWEAIAIAYGILAFQFDVHPMILTVQVDMADKTKLGQAILAGFSVTGSLFVTTTILSVIRYGGDVEYNLLRSLPSSELLDINVLLVTLQICLSTVVGCTALFQDLEDKLGIKKEFNWTRCLFRTSVVLLSITLSEIVPRFDLIMGLVGGSMMGPLMFVLPPLFYSRLRAMEPQPDLETIIPQTTEDVVTMTLGMETYTTIITKKKYYYLSPSKQKNISKNNKKLYKYSYDRLPNDENEEDNVYKPSCFKKLCRKIKNNFLSLVSLDDYPKIGPMVVWERIVTMMIVFAGLTATVLSTYFSLREAINYARFTPPCFINVTAATLDIE